MAGESPDSKQQDAAPESESAAPSDRPLPTITASEFGEDLSALSLSTPAPEAAPGAADDKPHLQAHPERHDAKRDDSGRDDSGLPQPGDLIADRYRIEWELARGGMGAIYSATQIGKREHLPPVALKWLFDGPHHRKERHQRFLREARAMASLQHPNIVRVYDAGEHESGVFLVMELLEGESLRVCMQRTTMTSAQAVDLLMPALRGIAAAHKKGIVHRDLKPDNIFVCKSTDAEPNTPPTTKVLDFGLSKLLGPEGDSLETMPGAMLGTPQYMAPEQAVGEPVDARSDIYSLGVILYEAVAGCRPFEALTLAGLLVKLAQAKPPHLHLFAKDAPAGFADAVMRALSRDPAQRPSSVEVFARELEPYGTLPFVTGEFYARLSALSAPFRASAAHGEGAARPSRATRITWLIGAALVAVLLGGLARRVFIATDAASSSGAPVARAPAPTPTIIAPAPIVSRPLPVPVASESPSQPTLVAPASTGTSANKKNKRARNAQASRFRTKSAAEPQAKPARASRASRPSRTTVGIVDPWEDDRPDPYE